MVLYKFYKDLVIKMLLNSFFGKCLVRVWLGLLAVWERFGTALVLVWEGLIRFW